MYIPLLLIPNHRLRIIPCRIWFSIDSERSVNLEFQPYLLLALYFKNESATDSHNRILAFPPTSLHLVPLYPLQLKLPQLPFGELQLRLQLLSLYLQVGSGFSYTKLLGVKLNDLRGVGSA